MTAGLFYASAAFSADNTENGMDKSSLLTETNTIADMIYHPALADFGVHLLPRPEDVQSHLFLRDVDRLMPWHSHISPQVVVQAVNRLITDSMAGKKVFYSFYEEENKKAHTGLFYFRGKEGAPFALICPAAVLCMWGLCMRDILWQKVSVKRDIMLLCFNIVQVVK